ncbi:unnamed protein product [Amoebophrya sp. A25]|nr:unnamed protein product [Amoebophrya sp. A25]|eukprot:GSA25T00009602001.1
MEAVLGRFTDRFQRVLDRFLKEKGTDPDVKSSLQRVLKDVLSKHERYETAAHFWEDLQLVLEDAIPTRESPASKQKLHNMRYINLEAAKVRFYTAETVSTLMEQDGEIRAEILESWIETLDVTEEEERSNSENGIKVLEAVLSSSMIREGMTGEHLKQVTDCLQENADKFQGTQVLQAWLGTASASAVPVPTVGVVGGSHGVGDSLATRNSSGGAAAGTINVSSHSSGGINVSSHSILGPGGLGGGPSSSNSSLNVGSSVLAHIETDTNLKQLEQALLGGGAMPPNSNSIAGGGGPGGGASSLFGSGIASGVAVGAPQWTRLGQDGSQVVRTGKMEKRVVERVEKQRKLQSGLGSVFAAQVFAAQQAGSSGDAHAEATLDSFLNPPPAAPLDSVIGGPKGKGAKGKGKKGAAASSSTSPERRKASAAVENLVGILKKPGDHAITPRGRREPLAGDEGTSSSRGPRRGGRERGIMETQSPLTVADMTATEMDQCRSAVGRQLESGMGMQRSTDVDKKLRITLDQNRDCFGLIARLDPTSILYFPDRVFLSAPDYLPHLRASATQVVRKLPADVVEEIVAVLKLHLRDLQGKVIELKKAQNMRPEDVLELPLHNSGMEVHALKNALDWRDNSSMRWRMFGPLEECLQGNRVPEVFFHPETVFLVDTVKPMVCVDYDDVERGNLLLLQAGASRNGDINSSSFDQADRQAATGGMLDPGATGNPVVAGNAVDNTTGGAAPAVVVEQDNSAFAAHLRDAMTTMQEAQNYSHVNTGGRIEAAPELLERDAAGNLVKPVADSKTGGGAKNARNSGGNKMNANPNVDHGTTAGEHLLDNSGAGVGPGGLQQGGATGSTNSGGAAAMVAAVDPYANLYSDAARNYYNMQLLAAQQQMQLPQGSGIFFVNAFQELCLLILRRLKQPHRKGKLADRAILPLILQSKYRVSDVNYAIAAETFWSYDAPCEILFRTTEGEKAHPDPLPETALPGYLSQQIVREVKKQGCSCKVTILTQRLNWNRKSDLSRTHGMFKAVLGKLGGLFYDPYFLYLKQTIDPWVEWPSSRAGRLFNASQTVAQREEACQAEILCRSKTIDLQPEAAEVNLKRQILGWIIARGGSVPTAELLEFLPRVNIYSLEVAWQDPYGLGKLLILPQNRVFLRRREHLQGDHDSHSSSSTAAGTNDSSDNILGEDDGDLLKKIEREMAQDAEDRRIAESILATVVSGHGYGAQGTSASAPSTSINTAASCTSTIIPCELVQAFRRILRDAGGTLTVEELCVECVKTHEKFLSSLVVAKRRITKAHQEQMKAFQQQQQQQSGAGVNLNADIKDKPEQAAESPVESSADESQHDVEDLPRLLADEADETERQKTLVAYTEVVQYCCEQLSASLLFYSPDRVWLQAVLDDVIEELPGSSLIDYFHWATPKAPAAASSTKAGGKEQSGGATLSTSNAGAGNKRTDANRTASTQDAKRRKQGPAGDNNDACSLEGEGAGDDEIEIRILPPGGGGIKQASAQNRSSHNKPHLSSSSASATSTPGQLPLWLCPGALVSYKKAAVGEDGLPIDHVNEDDKSAPRQHAVVLDTTTFSAASGTAPPASSTVAGRVKVRLLSSQEDDQLGGQVDHREEMIFAFPVELLPKVAEVNSTVRVVGTAKERGQSGLLIGLNRGTAMNAGTTGVVQLIGNRYITLPLENLVPIASGGGGHGTGYH